MAEKRKYGLMLFMVVIMIGTTFSIIFYGFGNPSGKAKQNGISFVYNGQLWLANINGRQAAFSFLPSDTADINSTGPYDLKGRFEIDATSDFGDRFNQSIALAQHQMGLTLYQYNIYLRTGFTSNNSYGMPQIGCSDATQAVPVIYFRSANATKISVESNCIIAEASSELDVLRIKDKLLYNILGVEDG